MVFRSLVHLGNIDMETAQRLDALLNPTTGDAAGVVEEPEQIAARLIARLREVTHDGFLSADFYDCCPRCGCDEGIQLDRVTPEQAVAFAQSLAQATPRPPE